MSSDVERIEKALGKITITGDEHGIHVNLAAAKNELVRNLEETQKESAEWRRLYHNTEALLATFRQAVGMAYTFPGATHLDVDTEDPLAGMKRIQAALFERDKSALSTMNLHAFNSDKERTLKERALKDVASINAKLKILENSFIKLQETDARAIQEQQRIIEDLRRKLDEVGAENYRLRKAPVKTAQHLAFEAREALIQAQTDFRGEYQKLQETLDDAEKRARGEK